MPNFLSKNKPLLLILASVFMSALLTMIVWKFDFPRLEAFFYDLHIASFKRELPSDNIKLINLVPKEKTSKSSIYFHKFSLKTHAAIIEHAVQKGAKIVMYAYDPLYFLTNEKDYTAEQFVADANKLENVFFSIPNTFPIFQNLVFKNPILSKLKISSSGIGSDTVSGAMDGVVRRILVDYNPKESVHTWLLNPDQRSYTGTFLQNDRTAVKARFSKKNSYESKDINSNEDVLLIPDSFFKNNIVIISLKAPDDLFDYRKIPYDHSVFAMMVNEAIANGFDTLIQKDNPKIPSKKINYFWTFFNLFIFSIFTYRLSAKKLFIFSFVHLAAVITLPLLFFGLTTWQLDTAHPFLILFLFQYMAIPFIFVKLSRQNDKDLLFAKEERERAINKAKITAKSAKADLGFRIATQVAHDIKSPVFALQTVRMVARADLKPDVLKLLDNSITRINNIADSLLKKFRSGAFETVNEALSTDIIATLQALKESYNLTHPLVRIILQSDSDKIFIPVDQTEIERAVTNILNNSIEAMENYQGIINIDVKEDDNFSYINIQDYGKGIPVEVQREIFKSGFSFNKASGTGIGLSQAKEALQKTGGDVHLMSSRVGETIFKLILAKSNLTGIEIHTEKNVILVEDNWETKLVWEKLFSDNSLNYLCFTSYKEFFENMTKIFFNPFENQEYTLITDLIFDSEDETGFEVIQISKKLSGSLLTNCYLCTSLSSNSDIAKIANELDIKIFGKKDLDKMKLISIKKS